MFDHSDVTAIATSIAMILDMELSAWDLCFQLLIAASSWAVDGSYALALIRFSQQVMVVYLGTDSTCGLPFETHFLKRQAPPIEPIAFFVTDVLSW